MTHRPPPTPRQTGVARGTAAWGLGISRHGGERGGGGCAAPRTIELRALNLGVPTTICRAPRRVRRRPSVSGRRARRGSLAQRTSASPPRRSARTLRSRSRSRTSGSRCDARSTTPSRPRRAAPSTRSSTTRWLWWLSRRPSVVAMACSLRVLRRGASSSRWRVGGSCTRWPSVVVYHALEP